MVNDGFQTNFDYAKALCRLLSNARKHKKRVKVGSRETEGMCNVGIIGRMLAKRSPNPWWKVAKHPRQPGKGSSCVHDAPIWSLSRTN